MASIAALRTLGDDRALPALRRGADQAVDGRVKRACRAAARRIEQRSERTSEVARLADTVDAMRKDIATLADMIRAFEARADGRPAARGTPAAKAPSAGAAKAPAATRRPRGERPPRKRGRR
jgi:hypothetical protein